MANRRLNAQITIGGTVTGGLRAALGSTQKMLGGLGKSIADLSRREKMLGGAIQTFARMGQGAAGLRREYVQTIQTIERLRVAQKRLADTSARSDRIRATAGTVRSAGVGASVAGGVLLASAVPGVKEAKHYETEKSRITALGLGDDVSKEAFEYARDIKTYGTSMLDNLELTRDALSIFTTMHDTRNVVPTLAKMKFGNAAMFGEKGAENSTAFMDMLKVVELRGGAHSKEDFEKQADFIQKIVSATGGRVQANEWRNVISTGGVAAKLMRDDAFYNQLEPLVQMQGGDKVGTGLSASYGSLYQGRTTKRAAMNLDKYGLIGDHSKVKHDKIGATSQLNPGALLGADLFRESQYEWVKQVLIPTLAKKGVTDDKEIVDVIGSLVSNKKGADLLSTMVMQRGLIDKDEKKNRGAHGVDQNYNDAQKLASGKELETQAKLADLKLQLGKEILPLYSRGLELVTSSLKALNSFTAANPTLTKVMIVGATVMGATLAVLGPVLIAAAGAMGIYAGAQMMMARMAAAQAITGNISLLTKGLTLLRAGFTSLIAPIMSVGAAIMTTPVGWIAAGIAAIVVGGVLIYKYWEPLKAFFVGFGEGVVAGFAPLSQAFTDAFAPVWNVIKPVVMPVLEAIGTWVKSAAGWFTDLFTPIDKASTTTTAFGESGKLCGQAISSAFQFMLTPINAVVTAIKWIADNIGSVINQAKQLGGTVAGGFSAVKSFVTGGPALPAPATKLPDVPPMRGAAPAAAAAPAAGGDTYHITQLPNENAEQLARRVAEINRQKDGVRSRSSMTDKAN